MASQLPRACHVLLLSVIAVALLAGCRSPSTPVRSCPTRAVDAADLPPATLQTRVLMAMQAEGETTLTISEGELTHEAKAALQGSGVTGGTVWLTADGLCIQANVPFARRLVRLRGAATLCVWDDALAVDLHWASVDGHLVPGFVVASLEKATNDALADAQLGARVTRVVHREGSMSLTLLPD